jgi:cellulose synthase/poly-beta-1,6-N-acetylglucosamine synthase-like glycosyltransferase
MKKISILIAVRNEEKIISSCLENLKTAINKFYKTEKNRNNFEVETLIGDDNDENTDDKSAEIIRLFIEQNINLNPNFQYFKINKNESIQNNLKGKANVIHQLINHSEGETIILLDADILVNQNWLDELVNKYYQNDKIKMIMGTTIPKPISKLNQKSFLDSFQTIDWISGQGILAIFSKLGFPQAAMGNNLAFDKKIYQEIGGHEKIEFSVTEDVALFKAFQNHVNGRQRRQEKQNCQTLQSVRQLKQKNEFFIHLFNSESLAFTESEPTLKDWVLQRHRWFSGAWQFSNFLQQASLLIYLFRVIFVLGIILSGNFYLIISFIFILIINFLLIILFLIQLKIKISFFIVLQIILFCITESFLYSLIGIHFLKTKKVKWKGREF